MARRTGIRTGFTIALVAVLLTLVASDPEYYTHETVPGDYVKRIDVGGRTREYLLHIPRNYDGTRPFPLLFAFHGSSASASVIERETSLDDAADSLGFVVVYPEGLHRGWNIGECCRYSFMQHVSETEFIARLLDHIERGLDIDSTRIYATGYSDGGTLSMLLGCALSSRITAVAAVSSTLFDPLPACAVSRPIPTVIIHGTADSHIPYAGQSGGLSYLRIQHQTLSAPQLTQFWVARDRCSATPTVRQTGRVIRREYECPRGTSVLFYTIEGGEHGWPGGGRGWIFSPKPPSDMSATDSIVKFFLRQRIQPAMNQRSGGNQ
jgi:polyhydroxybutyrate depolymerase